MAGAMRKEEDSRGDEEGKGWQGRREKERNGRGD